MMIVWDFPSAKTAQNSCYANCFGTIEREINRNEMIRSVRVQRPRDHGTTKRRVGNNDSKEPVSYLQWRRVSDRHQSHVHVRYSHTTEVDLGAASTRDDVRHATLWQEHLGWSSCRGWFACQEELKLFRAVSSQSVQWVIIARETLLFPTVTDWTIQFGVTESVHSHFEKIVKLEDVIGFCVHLTQI